MELSLIPVILALPPAGALIASLVGPRPRVAALIGLATALVTGLVLLVGVSAESTPVTEILGRSLMLDEQARGVLLRLSAGLGLLGLVALVRPEHSAVLPAGLAAWLPLAAAFMLDSISLGSILVLFAIALLMPGLVGGRFGVAAAAWRYFLMCVPAVVLFLLADWLLITGQGASSSARLSLLAGSLLLLGGVPFHIWVGGLARGARPQALVSVLGLYYGAAMLFVLGVLESFPLVRTSGEFQTAIRWSAALTALLAGLLLLRARSPREAVGYALLLDTGFLLLTLIMPAETARQTALVGWVGRSVVLLLFAAAPDPREGLVWRILLPAYACLALLGLPLTPSFPARWTAMQFALGGGATGLPWVALLLAAAVALGALGMLRVFRPAPAPDQYAAAAAAPVAAVTFLALIALILSLLP